MKKEKKSTSNNFTTWLIEGKLTLIGNIFKDFFKGNIKKGEDLKMTCFLCVFCIFGLFICIAILIFDGKNALVRFFKNLKNSK